jgi:hypothetical protein
METGLFKVKSLIYSESAIQSRRLRCPVHCAGKGRQETQNCSLERERKERFLVDLTVDGTTILLILKWILGGVGIC